MTDTNTAPETGAAAAVELRAAAAVLGAHLADPELTPGPWLSMDRGDRLVHAGPRHVELPPVYVVNEPMPNGANADWIALMHPGVGAVIRKWLHDCALWVEQFEDYEDAEGSVHHALAVARLVNDRPR